MGEVERLLKRELSSSELDMLVRMRDAGKSPADIAEVLGREAPRADPRTRRYEAIGNNVLVDITDVPIPTGDAE
jgi:hypothetical protein